MDAAAASSTIPPHVQRFRERQMRDLQKACAPDEAGDGLSKFEVVGNPAAVALAADSGGNDGMATTPGESLSTALLDVNPPNRAAKSGCQIDPRPCTKPTQNQCVLGAVVLAISSLVWLLVDLVAGCTLLGCGEHGECASAIA